MGRLRIFSVPAMQTRAVLQVTCRMTESYNFQQEEDIYSDAEEPFQNITREQYPNLRKNIRKRMSQAEREKGEGQGRVLKKIAALVQEETKALREAGVEMPSTSAQSQSKVTGAKPTQAVPDLPAGILDCPMCDKKFQSHAKLKDHYAVHSFKSKWTCFTCEIPFTSNTGLKNHQRLHDKFKCVKDHGQNTNFQCAGYYDTLQELQDYLNLDPGYAGIPDTRKCDLCAKHFKNRAEMLKHRKHRCYQNPGIEIEYFHCQYCGSRYREKKYVNQHEKYNCPKGPQLPHPKPKRKAQEVGEEEDDGDEDDQ